MNETIVLDKLDSIDKRLDKIDGRLDKMDKRFDKMDERLDKMDERFDKMDEHFDRMDERFDRMDERLGNLENDVRDIRLTIENKIWPGISIIGENHVSLSQKLNEILHINDDRLSEHETMKLKINSLDTDMTIVKERLNITA